LFCSSDSRLLYKRSSIIELDLLGQGTVGPDPEDDKKSEQMTNCIFLSTPSVCKDISLRQGKQAVTVSSLPIPLPQSRSNSILKLLSFAYRAQPISKSLLLTISPLLINRDNALYDNIPWQTWTIDPLYRNRDAANNPINERYHLGKRDAYNRFMGKDYYGRSLSIGNLAARGKYMLEGYERDNFDEAAALILAKRVLDLELKEAKMAVAEAEEQLVILRVAARLEADTFDEQEESEIVIDHRLQHDEAIKNAEQSVNDAKDFLLEVQEACEVQQDCEPPKNERKEQNFFSGFLSAIMENQKSDAPYRGAMGYKPVIDTKEEMFEKSILPYSSPFELMNEIINEQLNANVIGCVIEDTSLFPGSVVLGGAIVLKRRGRKKIVRLDGKEVEWNDSKDDYGSDGIKGGESFIVECDCDEAIGIAITCGLGVGVERSVWDNVQISVSLKIKEAEINSTHIMNTLPFFENVDKSIVIKMQGYGVPSIATPLQVPRTTFFSLFRSLESSPPEPADTAAAAYNTDNPVQSLTQYDGLSVHEKAQMLLSMGSFNGRLPRPRVLRRDAENRKLEESKKRATTSLDTLDRLLIPLIDESVRNQILFRDAERMGDSELASTLREKKSKRQVAKENAQKAINDGNDVEAVIWEQEADFYESLRADVTQDEGSYSKFLDKDDWYEEDRQRQANQLSKKDFGTLLDGIE